MRTYCVCATTVALLALQGCAGTCHAKAFKAVDLQKDLEPAVLARYEEQAAKAARRGPHGHVLLLESSNGWALGLLGYWSRGKVEAVNHGDGSTVYSVSESRGYGPLAILYVSEESALFGARGRRFGGMSTESVLWGHLAMFHDMSIQLDDGTSHDHHSVGFAHHLVNVSREHGKSTVSFLSSPNPVGF